MEYDSAVQRKEPLTYAATWVNLTDIRVSERSPQTQNITNPFMWNSRPGKINLRWNKLELLLPEVEGGVGAGELKTEAICMQLNKWNDPKTYKEKNSLLFIFNPLR